MASDCSFDVVSKVDLAEVRNAVDQAMKEIGQRYDFKGSVSKIELKDDSQLVLTSDDEIKLKAVVDVLQSKLHKRGVSIRSMEFGKLEPAAKGSVRQEVKINQGIPVEKSKKLVAEPGGAVALAALMTGQWRSPDDGPVGVVVCGGNADALPA